MILSGRKSLKVILHSQHCQFGVVLTLPFINYWCRFEKFEDIRVVRDTVYSQMSQILPTRHPRTHLDETGIFHRIFGDSFESISEYSVKSLFMASLAYITSEVPNTMCLHIRYYYYTRVG